MARRAWRHGERGTVRKRVVVVTLVAALLGGITVGTFLRWPDSAGCRRVALEEAVHQPVPVPIESVNVRPEWGDGFMAFPRWTCIVKYSNGSTARFSVPA